jgi:two-component system cell cycle response regulator
MDPDFGATTHVLRLDQAIAPEVLLVDDDELVLARLQGLIAAAGFEVCTAVDGLQALDSLEHNFKPIVILDLNMPGLDGLTVCRTIRERVWPGYVYILLLTAQDAEQDILEGLDAGADDYLSKRSSSAHLLARLRTAQRILTLEHSLKQALAEKRQLAMTDALTGAPNRRFFMRRFGREFTRLQRTGGDLSLLSLDIDHFKQVNDRHGHGAGDAVLQEFVRRIATCLVSESQWCARLGGEEFAVVLEGATVAQAVVVAERIRRVIAGSPIQAGSASILMTVSIGMSTLRETANRKGATLETLLQQADQRLYASKEAGRNRVTAPERAPPLHRGR